MAALFPAFISAITGGGGAAAGGAAAASGAAAAGAGAFSSFASIASIGSTVVGGLASIAAGNRQAAAQEQAAMDSETQAVQETITGRQDALQAMRQLNQNLAKVSVAGFASGLDSSGSISAAQNQALEAGQANIDMSRTNAAYASARRRGQSNELRREATGSRLAGYGQALSGGLSLLSRRTDRG